MSFELAHLRAGRARQAAGAGGGGMRVARATADYERLSVGALLVFVPVTGAPMRGLVPPGRDVANERRQVSSWRRAGCRLIINREE